VQQGSRGDEGENLISNNPLPIPMNHEQFLLPIPMNYEQLQRIAVNLEQIQASQLFLTPQQQHYLIRVLRLREGDQFIAMDGKGQWWLTKLCSNQEAEILESVPAQTELPVQIKLIAALPKGSGFDEVVRQTTELGVSEIVPVLSERTLLNPSSQKVERWRRIAKEASEQSERQFVPIIQDPELFSHSLSKHFPQDLSSLSTVQLICVTRRQSPSLLHYLGQFKTASPTTPLQIVVAIGPEGGWTSTEIEQAITANFQPASLGKRILRAVTAPVVALSLIGAVFEA
jgi:16S rRNA (uracil1498-N3)-methyltransferase